MSNYGQVNASQSLGVDSILVKPKRAIGPFEAHVTIREVHTDEIEITDQPVEQGAAISDHAFRRPSELVIECAWSNSPKQSPEPPQPAVVAQPLIVPPVIESIGIEQDAQIVNLPAQDIPVLAGPPIEQASMTGNSLEQVKDVYQKLLDLQRSMIPLDVFTGKRTYANMLVKSLVVTTDKETENSLHVVCTLREVLIAQVALRTISAPRDAQEQPESTAPMQDRGRVDLAPAANLNVTAAQRAGIDAVNAKIEEEAARLLSPRVQDLIDQAALN
jgi:hypothetical protein